MRSNARRISSALNRSLYSMTTSVLIDGPSRYRPRSTAGTSVVWITGGTSIGLSPSTRRSSDLLTWAEAAVSLRHLEEQAGLARTLDGCAECPVRQHRVDRGQRQADGDGRRELGVEAEVRAVGVQEVGERNGLGNQ